MSFGSVLRELRKENNMTQEQLAQKLSISPQAVSRWETDFAMPDISLVVPIAEIFDVSTDVLLGLEDKDFNLQESQRQEAVDGFFNSIRCLLLLDTIEACDIIEKILNLVFEDGNFLGFHDIMIHCLTTKARLLERDEKNDTEIVNLLRKAQYHAKELDNVKISFPYAYTNNLFKGLYYRRTKGNDNTLYMLNTGIVYSKSSGGLYTALVDEIKKEGTYYQNGITSRMISF